MGLIHRIAERAGFTPSVSVPAVVDRALAEQRALFDAETRALVSTYGEAFARGIEMALRGGGQPLGRFGRPEFSTHELVFACMTLIADAVAAVPFKLYRKQPDGTPGDVVPEHPLLEALADPFPELYPSFAYFVELMVMYGLGGGNFWVHPDETVRSKTRIPISFLVLGRQHVRPWQHSETWQVLAWDVFWGARPKRWAPEALHHFKRANPDDPSQILGCGELEAARRSVNADFARQVYDEQFFVNGGSPSSVLKYDPKGDTRLPGALLPDQLKQAVEAFADKHAGAEKMQKIAGLNAGWSLERYGVTQRDMEFVESAKDKLRRVAMTFRVPSVLLNDREHGGLSQEELRGAYTQLALAQTVPWCTRLSAFFQRVFVDRYAPGLLGKFDVDEIDALKVNFDKKVENYVRLVGAQVSPKQANDLVDLGLDPATLSDEPLVPFSLAPLSEVLAGNALDVTPTVPPQLAPPVDPEADDEVPTETAPAPPPAERRRVLLIDAQRVRRSVEQADRAALRLARWRAFVATFTPLERRYRVAIRKYVFALRAETLTNLAGVKARGVEDDLRRILFDEAAADETLRNLSRPYFTDAVRIGSEGAAAALSEDAIGLDAPGMEAFLQVKEIRVTQINDTIRDALRVQLGEGLRAGETTTDLALRVRSVFDVSATRSRTIARTEIATTVNGARYLEMGAQGIEQHQWLDAKDDHVRESHHAIDGEIRNIGEEFSNGVIYPGDARDGVPASEVVNCRCVTEPVS